MIQFNREKIKRISVVQFFILLIVLFFLVLVLWLILWQAGILKQERPLPAEFRQVKEELEFIRQYNFKGEAERLQQLMPTTSGLSIPVFSPAEIGKENIFE